MKAILAAAAAVAALTAASAASAQSALFECRTSDTAPLENLTEISREDTSDDWFYEMTINYAVGGFQVFGFSPTALRAYEYDDGWDYEFTLSATVSATPEAVIAAAQNATGKACEDMFDDASRCYIGGLNDSDWVLSISRSAPTEIWCSERW